MTRVLLTGSAGKVGRYTVGALVRDGMEVVASDLALEGIPGGVRFHRCDLTDANAVHHMMSFVRPDVIVHCAAVVAPIAYAEPGLADAVNLGGTRNLIEAAERHVPDAFFTFVSSYAAFGPACPGDPIRRPSDPCSPADTYGSQKLTAEKWLSDSALRGCSLRLGAVLSPRDLMPKHPSYRPFVFMVSLDQPEHGVDVRDVARAIASAASLEADGKIFLIGGDDSWKTSAGDLRRDAFGALGLSTPPARAFRAPTDANVPDGWFYECWMDTEETQRELQFQRMSRPAFMAELQHRNRLRRLALTPARRLIGGAMMMTSPYMGRRRIEAGPTIWDDICSVYRVPPDVAAKHGAIPTHGVGRAPAP